MNEIRARLVLETARLSKLSFITQDAGEAAHKAGDTQLQHRLERIDWAVQKALRLVVEATEITNEGESNMAHELEIIDGQAQMFSAGGVVPWHGLGTIIEDDVFIAPCVVTTNDNFMGRTERRHALLRGATIRRGARVGGAVVLCPGVEVGEEAFIGAGAVVTIAAITWCGGCAGYLGPPRTGITPTAGSPTTAVAETT